jgi:colanic acid biosynthesis glycosyl transferase WcaI
VKILVHDYAGHPFQVQLSRELARRGHQVLHLHFQELQTPKGKVARQPDDPPAFSVEGARIGEPFQKRTLLHRRRQELAYAARAAQRLSQFAPEVVLSANTPLEVQKVLMNSARRLDARFVIWMQDVYCAAVAAGLKKKLGFAGDIIGKYYQYLEKSLLRRCDQVVLITEDFLHLIESWGVAVDHCHVVENWAPLDEFTPLSRDNAWARRHGIAGDIRLLYSGTLGMKHNPGLLLQLAEAWREDERVQVIVVSEGPGRDWLERERAARGLRNLALLDFQPYEDLPQVLASGDILLAVLERDAGVFAVPSKVLTYLCAGRPLVAAVPKENLAARTVTAAKAGFVVEPDDPRALMQACRQLVENSCLRITLGRNAREYAERHFDIKKVADRFEVILDNERLDTDGFGQLAAIRRNHNG